MSLLTDALGSTIALADSAGAVQTSYTYEPFGKTSTSGAANSSTYQYTGREADAAGLNYYRARYYSPTMQRFVSEDPIGFGGGDVNLYAYVGSSSTNRVDPLGLWCPEWKFWECDFSRVTTPLKKVGEAFGDGFAEWGHWLNTAGEWMITGGRKTLTFAHEHIGELGTAFGCVVGLVTAPSGAGAAVAVIACGGAVALTVSPYITDHEPDTLQETVGTGYGCVAGLRAVSDPRALLLSLSLCTLGFGIQIVDDRSD